MITNRLQLLRFDYFRVKIRLIFVQRMQTLHNGNAKLTVVILAIECYCYINSSE
jgi:hypothetical protein